MTDDTSDGLAELVAGLLEKAGQLGDAQAEGISAAANDHGGGCVPMDDLREACTLEVRNVLGALTGRTPLDTAICTEIGRRRARQEVPETTLVTGYRVGLRFVWELLIAEAERTGLVDHEGLVAAASTIWAIQDRVLEAAVAGHREATGERFRATEVERSALLEALLTDRVAEAGKLRATADVLRMPRYGRFAVVTTEVLGAAGRPCARVEQALRRVGIHSVWHTRANARVGIVQLAARRRLDELVEVLEGEAVRRTGVSPVYEDLYQTAAHLRYAEIAMLSGRADGCAVSVFDDNLVASAAAAAPEIARRLAADVYGPLDVLPEAEREVLLETLETWLACGGSTEETARRMYCHPNTVRLRFRRLAEHTGRSITEPRGITELVFALYALRQDPVARKTT
ncbi:MAG TPA: helix-turn-helix domain-containing protein [Actinospica sp.]|nr:helix-turn-helix domain-containing protein [Actinospica sp.]